MPEMGVLAYPEFTAMALELEPDDAREPVTVGASMAPPS
jgi:hypothetical protein